MGGNGKSRGQGTIEQWEVVPTGGWSVLLFCGLLEIAGIYIVVSKLMDTLRDPYVYGGVNSSWMWMTLAGILLVMLGYCLSKGLVVVQQNQALVLMDHGEYGGTVVRPGFYWTSPLGTMRAMLETLCLEDGVEVRKGGIVIPTNPHTYMSPLVCARDAAGKDVAASSLVTWHVDNAACAALATNDLEGDVQSLVEAGLHEALGATEAPATPACRERESLAGELEPILAHELAALGVVVDSVRVTRLYS